MIIIIAIAVMIVSMAVSYRLKSKFKKYSQTPLRSGMSGSEIAEKMLYDNGIYDVQIMHTGGQLTDHYNPVNKTVSLSEEVYFGRNAAAAAVAAHECGHALQHAKAYAPLKIRSALVPLQNVSAKVINIVFFAMLFGAFALPNIINPALALLVIVTCYAIFTLFAFVTLPVEFDASKRALNWLQNRNITTSQEQYMAKDALKWAAMTYVVTAIGSLATLLYYLSLFLGSRD